MECPTGSKVQFFGCSSLVFVVVVKLLIFSSPCTTIGCSCRWCAWCYVNSSWGLFLKGGPMYRRWVIRILCHYKLQSYSECMILVQIYLMSQCYILCADAPLLISTAGCPSLFTFPSTHTILASKFVSKYLSEMLSQQCFYLLKLHISQSIGFPFIQIIFSTILLKKWLSQTR
jgi:hypothetical protein